MPAGAPLLGSPIAWESPAKLATGGGWDPVSLPVQLIQRLVSHSDYFSFIQNRWLKKKISWSLLQQQRWPKYHPSHLRTFMNVWRTGNSLNQSTDSIIAVMVQIRWEQQSQSLKLQWIFSQFKLDPWPFVREIGEKNSASTITGINCACATASIYNSTAVSPCYGFGIKGCGFPQAWRQHVETSTSNKVEPR